MGDEDAARHGTEEWGDRLVEWRRLVEIDRADAVDDDGGLLQRAHGAGEAVEAPPTPMTPPSIGTAPKEMISPVLGSRPLSSRSTTQ